MSASDAQLGGASETFRLVLVTAGTDLLDWSTLDALNEAGCCDATVGHDAFKFTQPASTRDEALRSAMRGIESIPGVSVLRAEFGEGLAERA